jgi:hypothetical protein
MSKKLKAAVSHYYREVVELRADRELASNMQKPRWSLWTTPMIAQLIFLQLALLQRRMVA